MPAAIVQVDDFFIPSSRRLPGPPADRPVGADFDWGRLRDQVLAPLRRGVNAQYERYDWKRDILLAAREVQPNQIVIVEGVYASRRELAGLYDLRVWVECPREVRLARGIARDGASARWRWEHDWMPSEDRYVEQHRPFERADLIVAGAPD